MRCSQPFSEPIHISSKPGSSYFLRVDWEGRSLASGFRVLLTDGQDAWSGEGEDDPRGEAEELEMTREKYIQDLERALTGAEPPDPYSFSLSPEPPGRSVTLTYEKMQKEISVSLDADAHLCYRMTECAFINLTSLVRQILTNPELMSPLANESVNQTHQQSGRVRFQPIERPLRLSLHKRQDVEFFMQTLVRQVKVTFQSLACGFPRSTSWRPAVSCL
uniref:XRCC4 N-terminal domain-containing protein n=1 Tax=Oryzias latipes TaxID=8090 RepID=A0A3P9MI23_ORYLA